MFCGNCGKEIDDKAVVCVHCGCATGNSANQKTMLVTILLWFFLGTFGAHRFYLGYTKSAVAMLLCLIFSWLIIPGIALFIWWIVDIIKIAGGSLKPADGSNLV